jgi:hypothetical protein
LRGCIHLKVFDPIFIWKVHDYPTPAPESVKIVDEAFFMRVKYGGYGAVSPRRGFDVRLIAHVEPPAPQNLYLISLEKAVNVGFSFRARRSSVAASSCLIIPPGGGSLHVL